MDILCKKKKKIIQSLDRKYKIVYVLQVAAWFYTNTVLQCMTLNVEDFHLDAQIIHILAMKFTNVSIAFIVIILCINSN